VHGSSKTEKLIKEILENLINYKLGKKKLIYLPNITFLEIPIAQKRLPSIVSPNSSDGDIHR
jgi:hypothetical protein